MLQLEAGRHRIALAPPYNCSPLEQLIDLVYTSAMDKAEGHEAWRAKLRPVFRGR